MWKGKSISVILPTYNEKDSIRQCILNFFNTGVVDEVVVVNNNAAAGTSEEVRGTGAREVFEKRQGYGAAIRRGFAEANGDYLVVCEPDGTFSEQDIFKLLAYAIDHEIVFGSRTVKEFIWGGANMGAFLRWGNYAVAKLMEVLFNTNSLSDVGCTFRLISRSALEKMQPYFQVYDNYFGPEMMLVATRLDISFVQIALNYKPRVGESSVTGNPLKAFSLGIRMIFMILMHRMEGSLIFSSSSEKLRNIGDVFLTYRYYFFYLVLFILCGLWMKKPLTDYLIGDASLFILLMHSALGLTNTPLIDFSSGDAIWHPFLYQSILIITGKIFGTELFKMRLIGMACLLVDLYLLRKIANLLVNTQRDGRVLTFLSCLFFLLIPLTIDGALHIDIDNTIMTPLLLAFFYFFILQEQTENVRVKYWAVFILMCIVMPLLLWSKLTTPLALPAAVCIFYLLKRKPLRAVIFPISLTVIGGCLFALTWYLFCHYFNLPFLSVFRRYLMMTSGVAAYSATSSYLYHVRQIAMIVFWFNTTMIILWLSCMFYLFRRFFRKESIPEPLLFAFILSAIVGIIYFFVGAISFGLAKYHYPLTAFIALTVAYYTYPVFKNLTVRKAGLFLMAIILLSILYFYVSDPLYLLTRGLKMQELKNLSYKPILIEFFTLAMIYILPCLILMFLAIRTKFKAAWTLLLVLALAQMVGFNFHKSLAGYHTSHGYGYYGAAEAYQKISNVNSVLFSEGLIIAPFDPLPKFALKNILFSDRITAYLHHTKPDAVVFGSPCNTAAQMKSLFLKPDFQIFMGKYYKLDSAGDYYLYLKK